MTFKRLRIILLMLVLTVVPSASAEEGEDRIVIPAAKPAKQKGSLGKDPKKAATNGEVLGREFGARLGHFAEYAFEAKTELAPALLRVRYARGLAGSGWLEAKLDKDSLGTMRYESTGGWGDEEKQFRWTSLRLPQLKAGKHFLRLTVVRQPGSQEIDIPKDIQLSAVEVLDRIGDRTDKNSVGHGRNIALYTGRPSRFFYATHELGDIFSAVDGGALAWYPDHVLIDPASDFAGSPNVNLDQILIAKDDGTIKEAGLTETGKGPIQEFRQVCVTDRDTIVSRIHLTNTSDKAVTHRLLVTGDCRGSFDWRGKAGGKKETLPIKGGVLLVDHNVFPEQMREGLCLAIGGSIEPAKVMTETAGVYQLIYEIAMPAKGTRQVLLACAVGSTPKKAKDLLQETLATKDPLADNRLEWRKFYEEAVPRFTCSDPGINELYGFRWFLLRFSTAGGDLGYFKHPVVLEGRQAYQTYCCYSAPFMAFDLNWSVDPRVGFGHMASMALAAYDDGRFPWYTSPRTNRVPIHHRSGTGLSLLPATAWQHYLIHGDKKLLAELYAGMKKNVEWWLKDRGSESLFLIDDQLETGMDNLFRWEGTKAPPQYQAIDATSYAYLNLRAVEKMARALGKDEEARRFAGEADKTAQAVNDLLWDSKETRYRDRNPQNKKLAGLDTITIFYPFFAGIGQEKHLEVFRKHLLDPQQFWLPHPVPALAKDDPHFRPDGFWEGPAWPAATSHVVEAFATSAKRLDRRLLPQAAELFKRSLRNHLQPRADFFEKYNPLTGEPLSSWSDYMHSWWIDLILRHAAGLIIQEDGSLIIDPLPMGLDHFALRGAPLRGKRIDVLWKEANSQVKDTDIEVGLTVRIDGKTVCRKERFQPGDKPIVIK